MGVIPDFFHYQSSNFDCVEQFARIKKIQDADKAAAMLYSFQ